jgi:hypothetical protein
MSTQSSPYGPPPHPAARSTRQLGPIATGLLALAITIGLIAASGVLALVFRLGG